MNQNIGISYSVTGVESVVQGFATMGEALTAFQGKLSMINSLFDTVKQHASGLKAPMMEVSKEFGSMTGTARTAQQQVGALVGQLKSLKNIGTINPKISMPDLSGAGAGAAGAGKGRGGRDFLGLPGFKLMAQYKLATEAIKAAKFGIVDIGMGRERAEIDESLGKLSALGFSKSQKYDVETASARFGAKFGHTNQKEYVEAMTYTGSSFDVSKIGMANAIQMNENAILMGKAGQMGAEQAAKFQNRMLNQMITNLSAKEYQSIASGGKANLPGMGDVTLGEASEKLMAMVQKSHSVSGIFGKETMAAMSQFGPIAQSMGMAPSTSLSLIGTLFDSGIPAGRVGRGLKQMESGLPQSIARMEMLGEGRFRRGATGKTAKAQEEEIGQRTAVIKKEMATKEGLWNVLDKGAKALKIAIANTKDPQNHIDLIKDMKMSRDFLPVLEALLRPGAIARARSQDQGISTATGAEARAAQEKQVESVGLEWGKLTQASGALWKALSASEGPMSTFTHSLTKVVDFVSQRVEGQNRLGIAKEEIKQWANAGKDSDGKVIDPNKVHSNLEVMNEINNRGIAEYKRSVTAYGPKPGKDASDSEKEEYQRQTGKGGVLWKKAEDFERNLWKEQEVKPTDFMDTSRTIIGDFTKELSGAAGEIDRFAGKIRNFLGIGGKDDNPEKAGSPVMPTPTTGGADQSASASKETKIDAKVSVKIGERQLEAVVTDAIAKQQSTHDLENRSRF